MTTAGFTDLIEANAKYAADHVLAAPTGVAAKGLAVLTCIDARLDPLRTFGFVPGDAKIVRNAGARVNDDAIRSLCISAAALGVERIAVVQHTNCKMASVTEEEVGALVAEVSGADVSGIEFGTISDQEATLKADVDLLRASPLLASSVTIGGFILDFHTGLLRQVV